MTDTTRLELELEAKQIPPLPVPKCFKPTEQSRQFTMTIPRPKQTTVQVISPEQFKYYRHQQPYQPTAPVPVVTKKSTQSTTIKSKRGKKTIPLSPLEAYLESLPAAKLPESYTVILARTRDQVDQELKTMLSQETVFGVDMEWKTSFKKGAPQYPIGLIQICGLCKVLLIQVAQMGGVSPGLMEFMKDPTIWKTGVNIRGDGLKLIRDYGVVTDGLLDLRPMAVKALAKMPVPMHFHTSKTLRSLTGIFLGMSVDKGSVRVSDWNKQILSQKQVDYAANDVYVSYALYHALLDASKLTHDQLQLEHLSRQGY